MCSQYIIEKSGKELARMFAARPSSGDIRPGRVVPHRLALILAKKGAQREMAEMEFGLVPHWSKERRVKFATHNARLISTDERTGKPVFIYDKPTWRTAFAGRHCLVPMTTFIEPLYTGPMAGNMVGFSSKAGNVIAAAGIWDEWESKRTGEVIQSFSILTDEPDPHIARMGHDRTPVFVDETRYDEWLDAQNHEPLQWVKFLRENRQPIVWTETIDRPLAKGWEKRAS